MNRMEERRRMVRLVARLMEYDLRTMNLRDVMEVAQECCALAAGTPMTTTFAKWQDVVSIVAQTVSWRGSARHAQRSFADSKERSKR